MNNSKLSIFTKSVKSGMVKHSPEILTGLGIAGMITSTVLAVKATPKALKLIEQEKNRQNRDIREEAEKNGQTKCNQISELKPIDTIKTTWKCYVPAAVTGAVSIGCLVGASRVHLKRNALLATAYKLSENALTEYKEKVVETIGEKKEKVIKEKIHKDHLEKNPSNKGDIVVIGGGTSRCYDYHSGRRFMSSMDAINKAINNVNKRLLNDGYVSLNEFYNELGLDGTSLGGKMGWQYKGTLLELNHDSQIDDDGVPCLVVDFNMDPVYDFDKFF